MIGIHLCMAIALAAFPVQGAAQNTADLQIMTLEGSLLGPNGQPLAEFDYLKPETIYRLMPDCRAELSSLDGKSLYSLKGPGVIKITADGGLTVNGKSVKSQQAAAMLAGVEVKEDGAESGGLPSIGSQAMRGLGVTVEAKQSDGSTKTISLYKNCYALVIGCSEYREGWPALPNPVNDAHEVAAALEKMGWRVDLVLDPRGEDLRFTMNRLITIEGRKEDQAILLWFSGHGHTLAEADGSKLGYIVPVDAPDPHVDEMGFMQKAMSMRQLDTVARRVMARHMLMMFDSCFSGALFSITRAMPSPYIEEKVSKPVRQFITAGSEDEKVPDKSVFKTVFLQGLLDREADRNKDSYVTGQELGAYMQEQVVNYSNKAQHPQYGKINNPKLDKGDFVFALDWGAPPGAAHGRASASKASAAQKQTQVASLPQPKAKQSGRAVKAEPPPSSDPYEAARWTIRSWNRAWNRSDARHLQGMLDPEAKVAVETWHGIEKLQKGAYLKFITSQPKQLGDSGHKRETYDFSEIQVAGDRAEVRTFTILDISGQFNKPHVSETFILVQQKGRWRILDYDFDYIFQDEPTH